MKPAARALASLLWAQKQDNVDLSALSGAQHLAGSGRTSFPVDKALPRDAYRVLGYKQCGERAVRVDILERLADLIRPALSWRESSPGEKPAGAFDGRSFVVTQAMTSLTGSAGEDFASVLRALGYRSEKRAPLPPKPVAVEAPVVMEVPAEATSVEAAVLEALAAENAAAEAASAEAVTKVEAVASEPAVVAETSDTVEVTHDAAPAEEAAAAPVEEPAPVEALPVEAAIVEDAPIQAAPVETAPEPTASVEAATSEAPQDQAAAEQAPAEAAATGETVAAAPDAAPATLDLIEVWRPGGRSEERRPRHDRNRHQRHQGNQPAAQDGAPAAGEAGAGEKREHHRRGRRNNEFRKPRTDTPAVAASTDGAPAAAEARPDQRNDRNRPPRERFEGKDREKSDRPKFGGNRDGDRNKGDRNKGGRDFGGRDKGGRDKRDSGPSHRQWATTAAPRERDRPIDPNSPFAKLAALKEQLAGNRKD